MTDNTLLSVDELLMFIEKVWFYMRSITGEGNRHTLIAAKELIPELEISEVPTGTKIWDCTVPKEWILRGAKVTNNKGKVILDSEIHNPHWPGETIAQIEILGIRNVEIRNFPFNPNISYIFLQILSKTAKIH